MPLVVDSQWTQTEYYRTAFTLFADQFPSIIRYFATHPQQVTAQPSASPTPIARRLTKADSFVSWPILKAALLATTGSPTLTLTIPDSVASQPILTALLETYAARYHPTILEHACRAFAGWPNLWTEIPTAKGPKKMQLLSCTIHNQDSLVLETVKIEGLPAKPWNEVKNQVKE
jgi:hypothetical protein